MQTDRALVELLNAANPVLRRINRNYRHTTDPSVLLKFCQQNWWQINSKLQPHGITLSLIRSARGSRNQVAHRDKQQGKSSTAYRRIADIHELTEGFQKAGKATVKPQGANRQTGRKPNNGRAHKPDNRQARKPDSNRQLRTQGQLKCGSCGSRVPDRTNNRNPSLSAKIALANGGTSVICGNCGRENNFDRAKNPTIFDAVLNWITRLFS